MRDTIKKCYKPARRFGHSPSSMSKGKGLSPKRLCLKNIDTKNL